MERKGQTTPSRTPTTARRLRAYRDSRGSAFLASAAIIVGQAWLANSLAIRPVWVLPTVSAVLLVGSVAVYRSEDEEPTGPAAWFPLAVVGLLTLVNAFCLVLLVRGVFVGSALDPPALVIAGAALWVVNVATFGLAYWEVDGGGPEDRARGAGRFPDLVFPQQQPDQGTLAPGDWTPSFYDYLYVSVTASTAFSPTDAMPYSWRAKLLMGVESTLSFAIIALLVARAVNIARG